eukprot:g30500.t1
MYGQASQRCTNARFVNCAHKIVWNVTQAQHNAIDALKTNRNIVIKPADKGGTIVIKDSFLQKLSTHGPVEPGTFLITIDISALYTSFPHDDSIVATASVLNTNNCQLPDAIHQLIRFILDHNVFTFDNQSFIHAHG